MSGFWNGSGMSGVTSGAALTAATAGASGASAGAPFAGMFRSMVEQTSALDQKASDAVTGLLNGQGVEIHDAMIATQKADMAFELALQVRNKAVGAYQQMLSMQF
jgi:flagellar hook-basal body complex protein FliE